MTSRSGRTLAVAVVLAVQASVGFLAPVDEHGYQALVAATALIARHTRTGGDISRWFGRWRPPERCMRPAAAVAAA